jgi:hypothetical protein
MSALALTIASSYAALPCARPTHARLRALLRFWEGAAREAGGLPQRRQFAFDAMVPWLGHVAVWAVERAPLRFKATLIGTRLVEWDGCDGTGRYLDEIISPAHREAAIARYVTVATSATWYADIVRFLAPHTTTATLHRLLLPCADGDAADGVRGAADRVRVDHIITAIFRDD